MKKNITNKYYYLICGIFTAFVFILNLNHETQQGTFNDIFVSLADNILNNQNYNYDSFDNQFKTYPIWGYLPLIMVSKILNLGNLGVLICQLILTLLSIECFYRLFKLEKNIFHIPLFLPFIALMSVKWPDAIAAFLIMCYLMHLNNYLLHRKKYEILLAATCLGILYNLRSEYIYLLPFSLIFIVFESYKYKIYKLFPQFIILIFISLIFILPWGIFTKINTGNFLISSTNGGAVAYISLGQLKNNKWGISYIDSSSFALVQSKNIKSAYSIEGDRELKAQFIDNIKAEPIEYLYKCMSNFKSLLFGGLYTGEYGRINTVVNEYSIEEQKLMKFNLAELSFSSFPLILEKGLRIFSIPLLLALFGYFILFVHHQKGQDALRVFVLIMPIILFKIFLVILLQYEARHINSIYLLLLGTALYTYTIQKK